MKLFVLGATGKTGMYVISQALAKGHEVTAFVRSPEKITTTDARLTVKKGDPTRADELAAALPGHHAVISVIGARSLGATTIHADAARATVDAMKRVGVRRMVALTSAFMFEQQILLGRILRKTLFKHIVRDHEAMERAIVESGLDWTLVRPPRLLAGEPTGHYQAVDERPGPRRTIRFSDVAHFMVAEAERNEHVHQRVGLSNA